MTAWQQVGQYEYDEAGYTGWRRCVGGCLASGAWPKWHWRPLTLYHLTWDCHVPTILAEGIRPNHRPNGWKLRAAVDRSRGKTFLCDEGRMAYWQMTYEDGWVDLPTEEAELVWLKVNVTELALFGDEPAEEYQGDYWTDAVIPAERVEVHSYPWRKAV